ncbi:tRNA delta(2)-isopentenylpyrophosphate transferase [Sediminicola sp. YIK13]|uniref:tRNA (adenosine(37)-N6)-dimethylallyltransferase MiaA n=1 Tax=Sediminicola sp. YIK13 TaxID=1453352 RepID=UPI0007215060|nr:tRNA (adenosine(37)-N6)-dimethylallyltransferase MiaA [Sediminicola sp. YIK13]ALM07283.1 tRNA delta(2)-isopentenylpyrophosphate transferase [Sediminicola sp. YIK13]
MADKWLISIVGPTGIGKTSLAIKLAQYFETEIISADSRQFFKEMTIGTAVPSKEELGAIKHHFIQNISIFDEYSVGDFERDAIALLHGLFKKKNIVIMVGGSGLYIDVVTKGLDKFPEVDPNIRTELNKLLEEQGITVLQEQLSNLDPVYFNKVDTENPHRLIRALEICLGTGKPFSAFLKQKKVKRDFKTISIGIDAERHVIYERINQRVDLMVEAGLVDEVRTLEPHKSFNALQTVGYRELFKYFEGDWTLDFAILEIKKNTRRFAKRQLTWFKKNENTIWVDYQEDLPSVVGKIKQKFKI